MSEEIKNEYDTIMVHKIYDNGVVVLQVDLSMSETVRVFSGWEQVADVCSEVMLGLDDENRDKFLRRITARWAQALKKAEGGQEA